jgi:hypothetical protein
LFQRNSGLFTNQGTQIILVDVEDVVFQTDPFETLEQERKQQQRIQSLPQLPKQELTRIRKPSENSNLKSSGPISEESQFFYVFSKDQRKKIGDDSAIKESLLKCFDPTVFNRLSSSTILSNSVLYGSYASILFYSTELNNLILGEQQKTNVKTGQLRANSNANNKKNSIYKTSDFSSCEKPFVDVALHQYLIYSDGLLPFSPMILPLSTSSFPFVADIVNTFQIPPTFNADPRSDISIFHPYSRRKYALLHQYNELLGYSLILAKKYLPHIHWSDPLQSEWEETPSCDLFQPIYHYDVLGSDSVKGKQCIVNIKVEKALNAASCCELCSNYNQENPSTNQTCTSFTFYNNVCYLQACPRDDIKKSLVNYENYKLLTRSSSTLEDNDESSSTRKPLEYAGRQSTPNPSAIFLMKKNLLFAYLKD